MARFELAADKTSLYFTKSIFRIFSFFILVIVVLSLPLHIFIFIGMAARKKQKQASNPYNLRKKVEIPVELQIENDHTFLNEFSRSGSVSRSNTDSDKNLKNPCHVCSLMTAPAIIQSTLKPNGCFYRHICSSCFGQDGKISTHSALDCKQK